MNACPALITRAPRRHFRPRIGRSRDFRRLWSDSMGVIRVFLHDMAGGGHQVIQYSWVGGRTVGAHLGRSRAVPQRAGEEPAGGRQISFLRDQHVDDLPELVDGAVQVNPPTGDLDVGFIGEPAIARGVSARPSRVDQQGREALYPAVDRDVVNGDTALDKQFFDVAVGQPVAQIPAHRQHDDLTREAKPSETRLRWRYSTMATAHQPSLPEAAIHQRNSTWSTLSLFRRRNKATGLPALLQPGSPFRSCSTPIPR